MVKTPYESLEHSVELYVQGEPPQIMSNLGKMDIYEGKELEIACLAKGVPLPTLKWFFKDKPVQSSFIQEIPTSMQNSMESRIFISREKKKINEGTFRCEATNVYGSSTKYASVQVITGTSVEVSFLKSCDKILNGFFHYDRFWGFSVTRFDYTVA